MDDIAPKAPIQNFEAFQNFMSRPETTADEAADANWELEKMSAGHGALERLAKLAGERGYAERSGREKISAQELNRRYPGLDKPFTEPEYDGVANIIANDSYKKKSLQERVEAGPQDAWNQGRRFVGSMLVHAMDPAEIGLQMITSGGFKALGIGAGVTSQAGKAALSVADNAVGAAVAEGFNAAATTQMRQDYTAGEFAMNTIGGAVMFEGFMRGAGRVLKNVKGFTDGFRAGLDGREVSEQMERVGLAQLAQGQRVDVEPLMHDLRMETLGDGNGRYQFRPIEGTLKDRPFYASSAEFHAEIKDAPTVKLGDDLGEGLYLTDNSFAANGAAARKTAEATGSVFEVNLDDMNLLNLSRTEIEAPVVEAFREVFGKKSLPDGQTLAQALELKRDTANYTKKIEQFNEAMKAQGYDGHVHDGSRFEGMDAPNQNHVMLFDKEKAQFKQMIQPNREDVPGLDEAQIRTAAESMQDPKRSVLYNEAVQKEIDEIVIPEPTAPKPSQVEAQVKEEFGQRLDELVEQGHFDEAEVTAIREEAKAVNEEGKLREKLMKAAAVCVRRNG